MISYIHMISCTTLQVIVLDSAVLNPMLVEDDSDIIKYLPGTYIVHTGYIPVI